MSGFVFVFSIFAAIWIFLNLFMYMETRHAFSFATARYVYLAAVVFLSSSYPLCKILEKVFKRGCPDVLEIAGSVYIGFVIYCFVSGLMVYFVFYSFAFFTHNPVVSKKIMANAVLLLSVFFCIAGFANSFNFKKREISVSSSKAGPSDGLKILYASDIHVGSMVGKRKLKALFDAYETYRPDVVLFGGDIVDESYDRAVRRGALNVFRQMKPRYGIFAVAGNHEYLNGGNDVIGLLRDNGINVLRDESATVGDFLMIAGRDDIGAVRFGAGKRRGAHDLVSADEKRFVVLLDHQPHNLRDADNVNVDLQLSGHTHDGQMWPLNYLTEYLFELSYGYKKKGGTHYYVSSGYGTWGPPIKLFTRPEYVLIDISFNGRRDAHL